LAEKAWRTRAHCLPVYTIEQTSSGHPASMKQTSSKPDGTPPPGSHVGLGLARNWSRVI